MLLRQQTHDLHDYQVHNSILLSEDAPQVLYPLSKSCMLDVHIIETVLLRHQINMVEANQKTLGPLR